MNIQEENLFKKRSINTYKDWSRETIKLLEELQSIAIGFEYNRMADMLVAAIDGLNDERFEVMVVGEFSNGKSTFVNALLGKEILPSAITPCTAMLTRIQYGSEQEIQIVKRNGEAEVLSEQAFKRIIAPEVPDHTEEERERAAREARRIAEIAYADIQMPTALGREGIVLIDSPGTNDMDAAREAITNRYIPNCDAVIFVIHAMKAFTQSEKSFLNRIKVADINKVFFIVNFKDTLRTEMDRERVLQRVRDEVRAVIPAEYFYLVSSRHELLHQLYPNGEGLPNMRTPLLSENETGFNELEEGLHHFLAMDRGAIKLNKPINRGIRIANDLIRHHIEFERRTLRNRIADKQQLMGELREQLSKIRKQGNVTMESMRARLRSDGLELYDWYKSELNEIASLARNTMDKTYRHHNNVALTKETIEKVVGVREKELQTELERRINNYEDRAIRQASSNMEMEVGSYEKLLGVLFSGGVDLDSNENRQPPSDPLNNGGSEFTSPLANVMVQKADEMIVLGGFLGVVTGIGLGIGGLLWESGSRFFNWLFGSSKSPYEKLEEEVTTRFLTPISDKCKQLERYWDNQIEALSNGFKLEMIRGFDESELQLNTIIRNHQLSDEESNHKLDSLEKNELKLLQIADDLKALNKEVQGLART